ncbi:hypothetical protein DFH11DRAFT_1690590 [Phellopilus nigrolimitatus]|nr:hypothetical protein DFH11DRAFT_1690590 [Phellopilus nigrolimitatus]
MITILPPEIVLNVLRYCSIQELCGLLLVSQEWNAFVKENESTVYHAAAIYHNFIGPRTTLEEAHSNCTGRWLNNLKGWKDLCQRWFRVEKSWEGRGDTPAKSLLRSTGDDVHRFKLEERENERFVITTHRRGGLRVTCMDTDTILFELGKNYVRHFAHCEYGNGFLIFDRLHPHALEIWRLESLDCSKLHPNSHYKPDEMQLNAPLRIADPTAEFPRRGTFAPWALFTPPNNPRAYRFVYPTLLIGSEDGQELYLFDVPSARLEKIIPIPAEDDVLDLGVHISYVELGARHVFVCSPDSVLIIPRSRSSERGAQSVHLNFPSADPGLRIPQLVRHYAARLVPAFRPQKNDALREHIVTAPSLPEQSTALVRLGDDPQDFTAVHVSPSGKDFVAITWLGVIYLVCDFERVFRGEKTFSDITLRINMDAPASNLAFDYDRVLFLTTRGVFVLSLHTVPHGIIAPHAHAGRAPPAPNPFPALTAHQLVHFRSAHPLRLVSCAQLTRTGVWLDWSARALEEAEGRCTPLDEDELLGFAAALVEENPYARRMVCHIEFAPHGLQTSSAGGSRVGSPG